MKFRVGRYPIAHEASLLEKIRADLPDGVLLMADGNAGYTLPRAIEMGRILGALGFTWFEEPLRQRDGYSGYEHLRAALDIALAGGEILQSRSAAVELLGRRAVDIVQPEPVICGGIEDTLWIADLAATHTIPAMPHTSNNALGIAAGLQVLACLPDPTRSPASDELMLEVGVDDNPHRAGLLTAADAVQGWLGDDPGRPRAWRRDRRGVPRAPRRLAHGHRRRGGAPGVTESEAALVAALSAIARLPGASVVIDPDATWVASGRPLEGLNHVLRAELEVATRRSRPGSTSSTGVCARLAPSRPRGGSARRRRRPTSSSGSTRAGLPRPIRSTAWSLICGLAGTFGPPTVGRDAPRRPATSRSSRTPPASMIFWRSWPAPTAGPTMAGTRPGPSCTGYRRSSATPALRHVVVRDVSGPVACASLFTADGHAFVTNVGTIPAARGRGLGTRATLAVLDIAHGRGRRSPASPPRGWAAASTPASGSRRTRCCGAGSRRDALARAPARAATVAAGRRARSVSERYPGVCSDRRRSTFPSARRRGHDVDQSAPRTLACRQAQPRRLADHGRSADRGVPGLRWLRRDLRRPAARLRG